MLTIDVNLLNNPVLITCPTQRLPSEQREWDYLTGYVLLSNTDGQEGVCIGGVRVIWQVTVQEAITAGMGQSDARDGEDAEDKSNHLLGPEGSELGDGESRGNDSGRDREKGLGKGKGQRKGKGKGGSKRWGRKVVIDQYETDMAGPMLLQPGQTRLEFGISVRPEIELSRVSRYDRIQHTLYGLVLSPPPGYASLPRFTTPPLPHDLVSDGAKLSGSACAAHSSSASGTSFHSTDVPSYAHADTTAPSTSVVPEASLHATHSGNTHKNPAPGLLAKWKNRLLSRTAHSHSQPSPSAGVVCSSKNGSNGSTDSSTGNAYKGTGAHGIIAQDSRIIPVWSLDISGEYEWMYSVGVPKMAGAGVKVHISSDALVLGGALTSTLTLTSLPSNMTIHAVSLNLVQTTLAPRYKYRSDEEGVFAEQDLSDGDRPFVIDEWTLASAGKVPLSHLAGRKSPETAWAERQKKERKGKGRALGGGPKGGNRQQGDLGSGVAEVGTKDLWRHGRLHPALPTPIKVPNDNDHNSSLTLTLPARLPSPLLGAASTTSPHSPPNPQCKSVTIAHAWSLVIHFSQLGTDSDGLPLTADHYAVRTSPLASAASDRAKEIEQMEGAVRTWTLEKGVVVGSDVAMGREVVAPTYDYARVDGVDDVVVEGSQEGAEGKEAENGRRESDCEQNKKRTGGDERCERPAVGPASFVANATGSYFGGTSRPAPHHCPSSTDSADGTATLLRPSHYPTETPILPSPPSSNVPSPTSPCPTNPTFHTPERDSAHLQRDHGVSRLSHTSQWRLNPSISLPQRRSHTMGNWTFLRAVERREGDMRRKVGGHWDETGGLCACFRQYGCAEEGGRSEGQRWKYVHEPMRRMEGGPIEGEGRSARAGELNADVRLSR